MAAYSKSPPRWIKSKPEQSDVPFSKAGKDATDEEFMAFFGWTAEDYKAACDILRTIIGNELGTRGVRDLDGIRGEARKVIVAGINAESSRVKDYFKRKACAASPIPSNFEAVRWEMFGELIDRVDKQRIHIRNPEQERRHLPSPPGLKHSADFKATSSQLASPEKQRAGNVAFGPKASQSQHPVVIDLTDDDDPEPPQPLASSGVSISVLNQRTNSSHSFLKRQIEEFGRPSFEAFREICRERLNFDSDRDIFYWSMPWEPYGFSKFIKVVDDRALQHGIEMQSQNPQIQFYFRERGVVETQIRTNDQKFSRLVSPFDYQP